MYARESVTGDRHDIKGCRALGVTSKRMKTASLGLLEVPVVRVNAGGDAPPDPPSVGDVTGPPFPLSLFSSRKFFGELAGKYF